MSAQQSRPGPESHSGRIKPPSPLAGRWVDLELTGYPGADHDDSLVVDSCWKWRPAERASSGYCQTSDDPVGDPNGRSGPDGFQSRAVITLVPVTAAAIDDACAVQVAPEQEHLVRPVATSSAEACVHPESVWSRLVVAHATVVAFVMAFLDAAREDDPDDVRDGLGRLDVDRDQQGRGCGRFAVHAVCDELETGRGRVPG